MGVLSRRELYDAREALDILSAQGIPLALSEVVRRFALTATDVVIAKPLGEAYEEYFDSIPMVQTAHRRAINDRVRRWVSSFGTQRPCMEVNSPELATYLAPIKARSPKSHNNALGYIKSFLAWCASSERKYLTTNPVSDMKPAQVAYKEPEYIRPDDLEKILRALEARPDAARLLGSVVLSFFCGIRQAEIERLADSPSDIMLDEDIVRISMPKGWTKGIVPRVVQIPPNARAWLTAYDVRHTLELTKGIHATTRNICKKVGVPFPANAGRHSFITFHVAAYGDASKTESMCGTSSRMRTSHYQGLASKKEAEKYFAIMPTVKSA